MTTVYPPEVPSFAPTSGSSTGSDCACERSTVSPTSLLDFYKSAAGVPSKFLLGCMNEELPIRESAEIPIENNPGCLVDHVAISKVDHPQLDEISLFVRYKILKFEL